MKVALVNPPQPELFDADSYPALGLLYIGAALKDAGHELIYIRADEPLREADAFCVTATTAMRKSARNVLAEAAFRWPSARLVVGGVDPTINPKEWERWAHCVVQGEGEPVVAACVEGTGRGIVKAGTLKTEDMDNWSIPDRRLICADWSGTLSSGRRGIPATTVNTSRGCPYSCTFCTRIQMTKLVRYHSVPRVVAEFKYLWSKGFRFFRVVDDMFALWEKRIVELTAALAAEPEPFQWLAITRADKLTKRMAESMAAAGCVEVHFGVETGSDRLMREVKKNETAEDVIRGTAIAKAAGLMVKWFLIAGLPTETPEDIEATKALVLRCRPDKTTASVFTPIPGSEDFQRCINDLPGSGFFYRNGEAEPELKRWLREVYMPTLDHDQATPHMLGVA